MKMSYCPSGSPFLLPVLLLVLLPWGGGGGGGGFIAEAVVARKWADQRYYWGPQRLCYFVRLGEEYCGRRCRTEELLGWYFMLPQVCLLRSHSSSF